MTEENLSIEIKNNTLFVPENPADLKAMLISTGIWQCSEKEKDGKPIEWDDFKVAKLFKDVEEGERVFNIVTVTGSDGVPKKQLETSLSIARAEIVRHSGDTVYRLCEGKREIIENKIDTGWEIEEDRTVLLTDKPNSISEKIKILQQETPQMALARGLQEELHMTLDAFHVDPMKEIQPEDFYTKGYPGLLTHLQKFATTLTLVDENNFQEQYKEKEKEISLGDTRRRRTAFFFQWEKVKEQPNNNPSETL